MDDVPVTDTPTTPVGVPDVPIADTPPVVTPDPTVDTPVGGDAPVTPVGGDAPPVVTPDEPEVPKAPVV